MDPVAEFEAMYLSRRPLASNAKTGPYYRHRRELALTMPYIEANPAVLQSLIVVDRDLADTDLAADLAGAPVPTYTALNALTGTGHLVYGLTAPVCLTDAAHRRPINLLAQIEQGLTTVLDGDTAYAGRITKNPLVGPHHTIWNGGTYELRELAAALAEIRALPQAGSPRRNVTHSAIGRNVALFDLTRTWAYKAVRNHWDGTLTDWETSCFRYAWDRNEKIIANDFTRGPLAFTEVALLARSISRWTWRKMTRQTFHDRQAHIGHNGGKRSAEIRKARSLELQERL